MARATMRTQNVCRDCRYNWFPRGHAMSRSCPNCGSSNIRYSRMGWVSMLVVLAVVGWFATHGKTSRETVTRPHRVASAASGGARASSDCGSPDATGTPPTDDWSEWACGPARPGCLARSQYTSRRARGCPGREQCCPPNVGGREEPLNADPGSAPANESPTQRERPGSQPIQDLDDFLQPEFREQQ